MILGFKPVTLRAERILRCTVHGAPTPKGPSSSSRAVCAAGGNSASLGRETGKSLSVCDLRGGLLVEMDEKAGFIFPKLDDRGEADMRLSSPAPRTLFTSER